MCRSNALKPCDTPLTVTATRGQHRAAVLLQPVAQVMHRPVHYWTLLNACRYFYSNCVFVCVSVSESFRMSCLADSLSMSGAAVCHTL